MRKFIFIFGLMLATLSTFAQPMSGRLVVDLSQYTNIETFPLEMVYFHSDKEIENDSIYSLGGGYYMTKVKEAPDFVVKFNSDRTNAVIGGHNPFFIHSEFTVKEDDRRLVLYSEKPYFGFIYDKKLKVLQYFTSRKQHRRFIRRWGR